MGFTDACFTLNDEALALSLLDWSAPALKGIDMARLKRESYAKLNLNPVPHAEGNFPTTSGKCEFLSSMAIDSNYVLPVFRQGFTEFQPGEPINPLPCYIPPYDATSTDRAHYPLTLLAAKPHMFVNSCFGNLPKHRKLEGEQPLTVGLGLSPGDTSYPEPYWYVSPYPYPDIANLSALDGRAFWHTQHWVGAVLQASQLTVDASAEIQQQ